MDRIDRTSTTIYIFISLSLHYDTLPSTALEILNRQTDKGEFPQQASMEMRIQSYRIKAEACVSYGR